MPTVYLTDGGDVEFAEERVPLKVFREWAQAVLAVADKGGKSEP